MIELMATRMKSATKPGAQPDNPSRASLVAKAGDMANTQLTRDATLWLRSQAGVAWDSHAGIVKEMLMPTHFFKMQSGSSTMATRLAGAPASLRCVVTLLNGAYFPAAGCE